MVPPEKTTFLQDRGTLARAAGRLRRHVDWARNQGVGRLIEEDQANPVDRVRLAVAKARWRSTHDIAPGTARPVFLAGVQRSGTNMVVRGLEQAGEFAVYNESSRKAFDRYLLRPDADVAELIRSSGHAYVLFKPLCDSHRVGQLVDDLATPTPARILWAYRAVDGRVRSAVTKFGDVNLRAMRTIAEGGGQGWWQRGGLTEERLAELAAFDWGALSPHDGAALFWYARNALLFDTGLAQRDDVLEVSYEAILADPDAELGKVAAFLDLPWRPALSAHVHRPAPSSNPPVPLHPRVRDLCDGLHARARSSPSGTRPRPCTPHVTPSLPPPHPPPWPTAAAADLPPADPPTTQAPTTDRPTASGARASASKGMLRNSGMATGGAALAILSGLLLDVALAARFGAGRSSDAFFAGIRLPLGAVAIIMAGTNQALVPLFSTWLVQLGETHAVQAVGRVLNAALAVTLGVATVLAVLAYPVVRVTVPGFDAADARLAADVARIAFFIVPLVCGAEVLRAYLNARYAYVVAAAMNVTMSLATAALVIVGDPAAVRWAAWAYLGGAAVQFSFMLVMAARKGWRPVWGFTGGEAHTAAAGRLSVRPFLAASLNPAARVVEQGVVSFLAPGTLTVVNYGNRLISAVGGSVFFRSVVVAVVPRLTEATARGDEREVREITRLALRMMVVLAVPLTAFLAVLGQPAMVVLFRRGNFDRSDAQLLGLVLAVYAASLVGSGLQRALLTPFFARLDTRTPLTNTVLGVVANLALLAAFVQFTHNSERWAVVVIAGTYSLAQYVNVVHAARKVRVLVGPPFAGMGPWCLRVGTVTAIAAAAMVVVALQVHLYDVKGQWVLVSRTALVGTVGLVTLVLCSMLLLRHDLAGLVRSLRRKGRRGTATVVVG